jgi:RNA polymerase sigma-70 factor (ECF subfamily)
LLATVTLATRNVEIARDATDEAFARAYERWSRVCTMAEPNGWLYRVALNVARRIVRRRAMEARALRRTVLSSGPPPELAIEVWDAVAALPRRERNALALRYLGGLTQAQVGEALGVTPGTVARLLHDARRALVPLLSDEPNPADVEEVRRD